MAANLAPIYLDDTRIRLQGDPRPKVSKILEAGGKGQSGNVQVMKLESQQAENGKVLRPEDVIDRTEQTEMAVYLKIVRKGESEGMGKPGASYPGGGGPSFQKGENVGGKSGTPTPGQGGGFGGTREAGKADQQGTQRVGQGGQQGQQKEFGRHETDREQGETGFGGQVRTSSAEQREWKPGTQGTGSTQGARNTSGGSTGTEERVGESGENLGKNRGNRPARRGETEAPESNA